MNHMEPYLNNPYFNVLSSYFGYFDRDRLFRLAKRIYGLNAYLIIDKAGVSNERAMFIDYQDPNKWVKGFESEIPEMEEAYKSNYLTNTNSLDNE